MNKTFLALAGALATLVSCFDSSSPSEKARHDKGEKKSVEPVSGQNAYYKMYGAAKSWAPDIQGYRCEPIRLEAIPEKDGRFPAWKCTFVSESKRAKKTYSYSVIAALEKPQSQQSSKCYLICPMNIQKAFIAT